MTYGLKSSRVFLAKLCTHIFFYICDFRLIVYYLKLIYFWYEALTWGKTGDGTIVNIN